MGFLAVVEGDIGGILAASECVSVVPSLTAAPCEECEISLLPFTRIFQVKGIAKILTVIKINLSQIGVF